MRPINALYLKIKTDAGLEDSCGPIDKELAIVVAEQFKPFLMGKDPLAGEALWDQMYRSNRHPRRAIFLMAISAVDNTLWDLRGRYYDRRCTSCSADPPARVWKPTPVAWATRSSRKMSAALAGV